MPCGRVKLLDRWSSEIRGTRREAGGRNTRVDWQFFDRGLVLVIAVTHVSACYSLEIIPSAMRFDVSVAAGGRFLTAGVFAIVYLGYCVC